MVSSKQPKLALTQEFVVFLLNLQMRLICLPLQLRIINVCPSEESVSSTPRYLALASDHIGGAPCGFANTNLTTGTTGTSPLERCQVCSQDGHKLVFNHQNKPSNHECVGI